MIRILAALALFCTACAPTPPSATPPEDCAEATLQIQECLASANAGEISFADCELGIENAASLCAVGKADGFDRAMCSAGVLHYCTAPSCDTPAAMHGDDCSEYLDEEGCASCDYYLCKEAAQGEDACGEQGYYLGFGYKYCERMTLITRPQLSEAGAAWLDQVRACLIEAIEVQVEEEHSCAELKQIAFDSHPSCYIDSGFCDLPFGDIWSVFMTVDPSDVEMRQVLSTGISCVGNFFL